MWSLPATDAARFHAHTVDMSMGNRLAEERSNFAAIKRAATERIVREERTAKALPASATLHAELDYMCHVNVAMEGSTLTPRDRTHMNAAFAAGEAPESFAARIIASRFDIPTSAGSPPPTPQSADVVHGDASLAIRAADAPLSRPRRRVVTNTAQRVRERKEAHPELFCAHPKCLWQIVERTGPNPCKNHPVVQLVPGDGRVADFDDVTSRTEVIVMPPIEPYHSPTAMRLQDVEADAREMIDGCEFRFRNEMLMHIGREWTRANERGPSESECAMLLAAVIPLWAEYAGAHGLDVRMISEQQYQLVEKAKAAKAITPEQLARVPVRAVQRQLMAVLGDECTLPPANARPLENGRRRT